VQAGDKVYILWGGSLPFILREYGSVVLGATEDEPTREAESHVLIVGECYVHGLADGQGAGIARKKCLDTQDI
jgi:hypothetical protein